MELWGDELRAHFRAHFERSPPSIMAAGSIALKHGITPSKSEHELMASSIVAALQSMTAALQRPQSAAVPIAGCCSNNKNDLP